MKKVCLYQVDFGKPRGISSVGWISCSSSSPKSLLVIANSYEQAMSKALTHIEAELEGKTMVNEYGDISVAQNLEINSVKIISEDVLL